MKKAPTETKEWEPYEIVLAEKLQRVQTKLLSDCLNSVIFEVIEDHGEKSIFKIDFPARFIEHFCKKKRFPGRKCHFKNLKSDLT